ncbi:hypothetical protein HZY97_05085 [Sphingomonas sp. R-74633]|uniref:hypothetical protein n=1 Tax=Sphingomonas sp. R-74633 TaxID=2751188 RepID=UPI0015D3E564|nr:hypothetical protein [Sphingomonas sp. R-74633]NYT40119.1 hypothetical protein [Sphingomonas sp. R-74633]
MLKGLLLCAAACAAPTTVLAGDRDLPIIPNIKALLAADGASRAAPPGRGVAAQRPTFLPIAYRGVERREIAVLPAARPVPQEEPVVIQTSFSIEQVRALPAWHLAKLDIGKNTTSVRGSSWAVYDILSDYRKPRFRRSALSTMLVWRIDGKEDTSPVSLGGGGVASALWKAMPGD